MGRRRKYHQLAVWMNGERVGEWRVTGAGHEFVYMDEWLSAAAARPISMSLPLRPSQEPYRHGVEAFFDNLLPDNREIRERIQRRYRTSSTGAFDLLQEIGRDCVGALQLAPMDETPSSVRQITSERLMPGEVERILKETLAPIPTMDFPGDTFRISLAGAQEKTALLWRGGAWHRPTLATPSTHIIKLPMGVNPQGIDLSTSVENEWLCAQIVKAYGIAVAACRMLSFGEFKTLVVERFDRKLAANGKYYLRLPQEDLCQATATPPSLKYESDGGPGIAAAMDMLLGSERAAEDRRDFMRTQVVFWMLAAIDGHAKNFSIFLWPGGSYSLTPRYDVLSAYPILGHGRGKLAPEKIRMAMAVVGNNRHYRWREIEARHWLETAKRHGLPGMPQIIADLVEATPRVIAEVGAALPAGFPARIADAIIDGVAAAAKKLRMQL
ncbi:MAG TPA: type II toxin-antitoxin system HipA family toxin [Verrucomicrobiae bacterium]|jgi:serine/threonine-protein kinase HipA|nr:type II toxin-antitoxin system HipA family toxin [Verrucomicrobiae bacterium]